MEFTGLQIAMIVIVCLVITGGLVTLATCIAMKHCKTDDEVKI